MQTKWFLIAFATLVAAITIETHAQTTPASKAPQVPFPENYREWKHVKSMVLLAGHPLENPFGGIHHVYANKKAIEGLKTGNYPDGAIFVFDLFEAVTADNAITEGKRKLRGVMQRNAKAYADTGGWGFEGFAGDSRDQRLVHDGGKSCFACHQSQAQSQFVFSRLRD